MKKQSSSGFMLIEVMISVLIFSVGVLALVGLQVSMTRAQTESKARADAVALANELSALMWSDRGNLAKYATGSCGSYDPCSALKTKVESGLPAGRVTVDVTTKNDVTVKIFWTLPSGTEHNYTTMTSVQGAT